MTRNAELWSVRIRVTISTRSRASSGNPGGVSTKLDIPRILPVIHADFEHTIERMFDD
jgi:hypothetical protein